MMKDFVKSGCVFTLEDLMNATLEWCDCVTQDMLDLAYGVARACLQSKAEREHAVSNVLLHSVFKTLDLSTETGYTEVDTTKRRYDIQLLAKDIYDVLLTHNWPILRPDVETILCLYERDMGVKLLGGNEQGPIPRSRMLQSFTDFTLCREYEWLFDKHTKLDIAKRNLLYSYLTDNRIQVLATGAMLLCTVSEICDSSDEADADAAHDLLFTCLNLLELLNNKY